MIATNRLGSALYTGNQLVERDAPFSHKDGLCRCCGSAFHSKESAHVNFMTPLCGACNDIEEEARLSDDRRVFRLNKKDSG